MISLEGSLPSYIFSDSKASLRPLSPPVCIPISGLIAPHYNFANRTQHPGEIDVFFSVSAPCMSSPPSSTVPDREMGSGDMLL